VARQGLEATARRRGATAVVRPRGQLDGAAEAALRAAYAQAAASDPAQVLLDFGAVTYINSTGIALIVGLLARARDEGRRLLARGLSEHYREIFEVTRLADFLPIVPDEAGAEGERPAPAGAPGGPGAAETSIGWDSGRRTADGPRPDGRGGGRCLDR
jgi:anti-anti-sigma factor